MAPSIKGFEEFGISREPATDDFHGEQNSGQLTGYITVELLIPIRKPSLRGLAWARTIVVILAPICVGIPVKLNVSSEGKPNGVPG